MDLSSLNAFKQRNIVCVWDFFSLFFKLKFHIICDRHGKPIFGFSCYFSPNGDWYSFVLQRGEMLQHFSTYVLCTLFSLSATRKTLNFVLACKISCNRTNIELKLEMVCNAFMSSVLERKNSMIKANSI